MNILHNLDNSNIGGIQELIFLLYKHSRHRHDFWAADGSMAPILREAGMVLYPHGPPDDAHFDVCVGHGVGGWSYDNGVTNARLRGWKFAECMHSIARSLTEPSGPDGFIAISHLVHEQNRHMRNPITIYGMVETTKLLPREPMYIGRLSRLVEEKRPWEFAQMAQHFPQEKFLLGGDGPERSRISTSDNLFLVGMVRNFPEFYRQLKLYVYPTRDEACCMTVAQAQCAGVPIICQDIPALRETTGGLVTYCHSHNDFVSAIQSYLDNPWNFELMAQDAQKWAMAHFSEAVVAKAWDDYIEAIVRGD